MTKYFLVYIRTCIKKKYNKIKQKNGQRFLTFFREKADILPYTIHIHNIIVK